MAARGGKVQKVMVQPINLIFRYLQNRSRIQIWLYEDITHRIEGYIIGNLFIHHFFFLAYLVLVNYCLPLPPLSCLGDIEYCSRLISPLEYVISIMRLLSIFQ